MSQIETNGIKLACQRSGSGPGVLLIMGSGASGRVWTMHQTPALNAAGYETITFDNRGIPPSACPQGPYALEDLVADTAGLITALDLAPCRIVGSSLGASIAQILAATRPELVRCAVLMATRARSDVLRRAQSSADRALIEAGITLPPEYRAIVSVHDMLSPTTLNDDRAVSTWLELFELSGASAGGSSGQAWIDLDSDRRGLLGGILAPCRVIAFEDDLICPPHLAAEVADAIPDCDLVKISDCGHLGNLERPEEVNAAVIDFLERT